MLQGSTTQVADAEVTFGDIRLLLEAELVVAGCALKHLQHHVYSADAQDTSSALGEGVGCEGQDPHAQPEP
jgi:hypothetical protein